jgi:spore coat protein U-like protein
MWDTDLSIIWETFEMKKILAAAVAMGLVGLTHAATANSTLNVNATVAAACNFGATSTTLTFPTFNPTIGAVTANADIDITCNTGLSYDVELDLGANALGSTRRMYDGVGAYLEYTITRPNATNVNTTLTWGTGTNKITRSGTGASDPARAFGTIPFSAANQLAATGSYTDVVNITITY